jgi:hypothetical protein
VLRRGGALYRLRGASGRSFRDDRAQIAQRVSNYQGMSDVSRLTRT